ncbi:MAG: hypothetical protein HWD62_00220 [Cyclobacteriaceae bacterium]|nr:MAG: hypothetical protein HWD62_00220 [Cyclobacteriaceae bacterium]
MSKRMVGSGRSAGGCKCISRVPPVVPDAAVKVGAAVDDQTIEKPAAGVSTLIGAPVGSTLQAVLATGPVGAAGLGLMIKMGPLIGTAPAHKVTVF